MRSTFDDQIHSQDSDQYTNRLFGFHKGEERTPSTPVQPPNPIHKSVVWFHTKVRSVLLQPSGFTIKVHPQASTLKVHHQASTLRHHPQASTIKVHHQASTIKVHHQASPSQPRTCIPSHNSKHSTPQLQSCSRNVLHPSCQAQNAYTNLFHSSLSFSHQQFPASASLQISPQLRLAFAFHCSEPCLASLSMTSLKMQHSVHDP
jgi:hypothetical protein